MRQLVNLLGLISAVLFFRVAQGQTLKVTLLGTGSPNPSIERFGPSTLIEAGGRYFLFDCGRGVTQRLWQRKIQLGNVNRLFLTHLHSDHIVGIPDLWLTGYLPANFGQRNVPLQICGPPGTTSMMESLEKAYQSDINIRKGGKDKIDSGIMFLAKDVREGVVFNEGGVTITVFLVDHGEFIDTAFGYRLDYAGHSVVISGDTKYSENLIRFAKGTDVLIHEVAIARPELIQKSPVAKRILAHHTSPEEAGRVFAQVNPKLAVYSHIVLLSTDPSIPPPTADDLRPRTRVNFSGPLEIGEDLMSIEIGDKIIVQRFSPAQK